MSFDIILAEHLGFSGGIEKWMKIRSHLIDQVHKKKCVLSRNKYKIAPGTKTEKIYSVGLFLGQKTMTGFDPWPCQFKSSMENVLFREMSSHEAPVGYDGKNVYYAFACDHNPFATTQTQLSAFDVDAWQLDATPEMTQNDIVVIKAYIAGFAAFLDALCAKTTILGQEERNLCLREINRIKKRFDSLIPVLQ